MDTAKQVVTSAIELLLKPHNRGGLELFNRAGLATLSKE
jgi:hypothetical protein